MSVLVLEVYVVSGCSNWSGIPSKMKRKVEQRKSCLSLSELSCCSNEIHVALSLPLILKPPDDPQSAGKVHEARLVYCNTVNRLNHKSLQHSAHLWPEGGYSLERTKWGNSLLVYRTRPEIAIQSAGSGGGGGVHSPSG